MANKGFNYEIRLTAKDDYSGAISGVRAGLKKTPNSVLDISVDLKKLGSTFDDVASDMIGKAGGVNDALKKVGQDGGLGKAGEGASKAIPQFNNLNFSVQQIVRELPSATMGANMFFSLSPIISQSLLTISKG